MAENNKADDLPPMPKARGRDRELWVGLFVIVAIAAVLTALYTMTDAAMFRGRYIISTVLDNAGGIRRGDPVQMRGVNIGRVQKFKMVGGAVEIRLEVEGEYQVPADSKVVLKSGSFLGGVVAEVIPGKSTEVLRNGSHIQGSTEGGLMDTAASVADSANTVMQRLESTITDETARNVRQTAASLEEGSREARDLLKDLRGLASEQRQEIRGITASLKRTAASIEATTTRPELDRSIARLDVVTQRLTESSASMQRATTSLESVLTRIDKGEGTLGRLTKDDLLYVNLNEATTNLNRLLEDVRRNPKRYVKLSVF
jgi:phospholipid/cholesterol/gamma-HCH transport system substrate-binding protein